VPSRSRSHRPALVAHRLLLAGVALAAGVVTLPPAVAAAAASGPPTPLAAPGRPAGGGGAGFTVAPGGRVPPLRLPVPGPVVRGFELPAGPFGAGHRGIDLAAPLGAAVGAPAAGRVVFAGQVAGVRWVSIEVAAGVVVTVGPLDRPLVAAGQLVPALARLGRLAAGHAGRLHLGLRLDGTYVDPLPYLIGLGPARLAPLPPRAGGAASP
jgi:murein DD-endopeptidase MepM/ murein hydrolase activator NlpD